MAEMRLCFIRSYDCFLFECASLQRNSANNGRDGLRFLLIIVIVFQFMSYHLAFMRPLCFRLRFKYFLIVFYEYLRGYLKRMDSRANSPMQNG